MSKSLKNFITIQDALSRNSSRDLRIFFLLHQWKETLDYSNSAMEEASSYEKMLREFFLNAKDLLRSGPTAAAITAHQQQHFQKWSDAERELNQRFVKAKNRVRQALCDNIDTKTSLEAIKSLISDCNKYLARMKRSANRVLIKSVAEYVTRLFQIFGVIEGKQTLGFPSTESSAGGPGNNDISAEEIVMPVLEALAEFREEVRKEARQLGAKPVLELCDRFRDDVLPSLGVRLEDREGQPPALKLVPRDELLKEMKLLKEKLLKEKEERKDARQAELNRKKIQLEELREARDARRAALNHQ
jgi:cysteinyl-tRNA synthetase